MPNRDPLPIPPLTPDTPRGPTATPGIPGRTQEKPIRPPIIEPEDDLNPNDPVLPVFAPDGGGKI